MYDLWLSEDLKSIINKIKIAGTSLIPYKYMSKTVLVI
jgi:hypothetical protein